MNFLMNETKQSLHFILSWFHLWHTIISIIFAMKLDTGIDQQLKHESIHLKVLI